MSDFDAMHGQEGPASEEGTGRSLGRDAAGLALFALATLLGVSVFMSLSRPAEEPRGTTALFTALCDLFGPWSLFPLAIALAFLGGRLWVAGIAHRLGRHLAGAAAVALVLSILASAASAGAGGSFGDLVGGTASEVLTPFAGVPLALAVLAGVIWAFWLRAWGTPGAPRNVEKAAPRRAAPTDSGGLTPDEAAALLPARYLPSKEGGPAGARESQDGDAAATKTVAQVTGRSIPVAPDLKPIYPPDVRLQGGIPEGTRPLETRDQAQPLRARQTGRPAEPERAIDERPRASAEPFPGPSASAAVPRAPQPHAAPPERPSDADLAAPHAPLDAAGERLIGPAPALPERGAMPLRDVRPLASAAPPQPPSWESELEDLADEEVAPEELEDSKDVAAEAEDVVSASAPELEVESDAEPATEADDLPPRPGWEQPGLFDEEPVDAYGTPTKLVDALRRSNEAAAVRLKDVPSDEEEELEEEQLEQGAEAELDLEEDDVEDEAEDDGEELEDSDDEAEVEEAYAVDDDSDDDSDDELDELDEELDEEEGDAEAQSETEEEASVAAESATEVEEPSEPEVVLEPRRRSRATSAPTPAKPAAAPRRASRPAVKATEELDPESDLLFRAGALFIQRGRVAVSMLQRDFNLDFKQATSLLDQLQEAGLIGPYLGGQRRDILLTIEEWRERRIRTA